MANDVAAVDNAVKVFCETVAIGAITVFVFAVFVATTAVIAEFNAAICAFAVSIAANTVALSGSGVGINAAPWLIVALYPEPAFVSGVLVIAPPATSLTLNLVPFGIGPVTLMSADQALSDGFTSALNLIWVICVSAVVKGNTRTSQAIDRVLVVVE